MRPVPPAAPVAGRPQRWPQGGAGAPARLGAGPRRSICIARSRRRSGPPGPLSVRLPGALAPLGSGQAARLQCIACGDQQRGKRNGNRDSPCPRSFPISCGLYTFMGKQRMPGCSEDLLARLRTEDLRSSRAPRPPRGKSPDRGQRVPGAAAPPPAAASRFSPPRRPRAERVSTGRALVTATDTQVARQPRQQNGAHSQAILFCRAGARQRRISWES